MTTCVRSCPDCADTRKALAEVTKPPHYKRLLLNSISVEHILHWTLGSNSEGESGGRGAGDQEIRRAGEQESRSAGEQESRRAGEQECRRAGEQECRSAGVQECRSAGEQESRGTRSMRPGEQGLQVQESGEGAGA